MILAANSITLARVNDGAKGEEGRGIKSTEITYQASDSGVDIPSGTWVSTPPAAHVGSYIWTRTVYTYTKGTPATSTSYSVSRIGSDGNKGSDGRGIKSTEITYQAGASQTDAPTGTWSTTVPKTSVELPYLWTKTVITYTSGDPSTSYSVSSTLDSIDVGGRNLLQRTNPSEYLKEWLPWASSKVTTLILSDNNWVTATKIGETTSYGAVTPKVSTIPGAGKYMLSFEAYSDNAIQLDYFYMMSIKDGKAYNVPLTKLVHLTTEPTRYKIPVDLTEGYTNCGILIGTKNGTSFNVREIKFESGTKATDWTPAPEDTSKEIQVVKTYAEQTAEKFTWIVESGDSSTNFTLTDKMVELISGELDIDALVKFKNAAETGSSTVINGGAIDTDTLRAGSISVGNPNMTLLDYLFSSEEHFTYDDDGNIVSSELVGRISNINESLDSAEDKLDAFNDLISGENGLQKDLSNLNKRYTDMDRDFDDYTQSTNSTLRDLQEKFNSYPSQDEVKAALNLIAQNNNKEILQYGSLLKYITADPINGLVIHGIDPILDESGKIQYNKKQKYDYAYNAETGQYVYEPVIDENGNPVMVDDPTNPICNESPYSVNINNTSFAIKKNNETITDITGSTMNISEAHIQNQFKIKNYKFSPSFSNDGSEVLNLFYDPQ